MATEIAWTDETWNQVRGCSRVNDECRECYAMKFAHRFSGPGKPYEGLTTIRLGKVDWSGKVRFVPEMLAAPLRWREPKRIFVNSMSDLFHESLTNEQIAAVFGVMAACPQHTFQILTKRPNRMRGWFEWLDDLVSRILSVLPAPSLRPRASWYLTEVVGRAEEMLDVEDIIGVDDDEVIPVPWPLPNVHLGVSCGTQKSADEFIPLLLQTPASVRFVSAEPLLEQIDIERYLEMGGACECDPRDKKGHRCSGKGAKGWIRCNVGTRRLNWLIAGGESGPGARPCAVEWIESLVEQCARARHFGKTRPVPCFVKQLGSKPYLERLEQWLESADSWAADTKVESRDGKFFVRLRDKKGGDMSAWTESLRVRQFPAVRQ